MFHILIKYSVAAPAISLLSIRTPLVFAFKPSTKKWSISFEPSAIIISKGELSLAFLHSP